jgi:hypothetical protein
VLLIDSVAAKLFGGGQYFDTSARMSFVATALIGMVFSFRLYKQGVDKVLSHLERDYSGVEELIPSSKPLDLEDIFERARDIKILTLAGTKIARLGERVILKKFQQLKRKSHFVLLLANPYSSAIQTRYKHDEPANYETGIDGLVRRLCELHRIRQSLPPNRRRHLDIRVFNNYPTCSIVIADEDVYSTVYGYQLRGSDCPKIHAKLGGLYSNFLITHFEQVYQDTMALEDWITEYKKEIETE